MYSGGEQVVWHRAFAVVQPRAVWLPHYPYPLARLLPGNRGTKVYVTVHDTIQALPHDVSGQSWVRRTYAHTMLTTVARTCSQIFSPSEATAVTLRKLVRSADVMVTPIPVDAIWFEPVHPMRPPVTAPYVLYVGNMKRYKNLPMLVDAFTAIAETVPHKLVIAGGGTSLRTMDDRVRGLVERHSDRIVVTGPLDFAVLRSLVAAADLLVMPSLHEGAGLPPLEAMASGTAVLSSDIPALRETCGDGAEFFDPYDRESLKHLLRAYCTDVELRAGLAARGRSYVTKRQHRIDASAAANRICSDLLESTE